MSHIKRESCLLLKKTNNAPVKDKKITDRNDRMKQFIINFKIMGVTYNILRMYLAQKEF